MKYKILITSNFLDEYKDNSPEDIKDFLEKNAGSLLCDDITTTPDMGDICYKTIHRRYNLWFATKTYHDVKIYIPKAIEDRSQGSYFNKFSRVERKKMFLLSDEDVSEIQKYLYELKTKKKERLLPSMEMFEGIRDYSDTSTSFVYEMYNWTIHIGRATNALTSVFGILKRIVTQKEKEDGEDNGWKFKSVDDVSRLQIVYRISYGINAIYYYLYDIVNHDDLNYTISKLKDITNKSINKYKQKEENNSLSEEEKAFNAEYVEFSDENLKRQARKGYPDFIIYGDFDSWKKIENDEDANLALSEEEIDVLQNTHYPCFINGQAGSGKSTILYYLFVNAYLYQLNNKSRSKEMIFLSYSEKLINSARDIVTSLGTTNYKRWTTGNVDDNEIKNGLSKCFQTFREFLKINYLSDELQNTLFDDKKHIDYKLFIDKYTNWYLNESGLSAEMVWAVIRSYIKGRNYKASFTPDQYANSILRNDPTVDLTTYKKIYKIYETYYSKLKDDGYWDDLDMINYILKKIEYKNDYTQYDVIFCDEAQDFTPVEIELILKTSKYYNYNLTYFKTIPIAFAGDPNQTISPTGFNWSRLKDVFTDTFREQIGGYIKLSDVLLNNNYRSKSNIIKLSNSIQYLRSIFAKDNKDKLQPQNEWNTIENPIPGFVEIGDKRMPIIESSLKNVECIITGDDGECPEIDTSLSKQDEELWFTPISAKGMEYNTVILYKFVDAMPESFSKIFERRTLNQAETYACEYFITKLYVAVTRARELMYIFDTNKNYQKFWKYFINNEFVNSMILEDNKAFRWNGKVGGIENPQNSEFDVDTEGKSNIENRIKELSNRYVIAKRIFDNAKYSRNTALMQRAKGYFSLCNADDREDCIRECDAYIYLYKGEYEKSGDKFLSLNKISKAVDSYWKGKCWGKLEVHSEGYKLEIAKYNVQGNNYNLLSLSDALTENKEWINDYKSTDETWIFIIEKIRQDALNHQFCREQKALDLLEILRKKCNLSFLADTIAYMHYKQGNYENAIAIWDECKKMEHIDDYYRAKKANAEANNDYNGIIKWANNLDESEYILNNFGSTSDIEKYHLNAESRAIVFQLTLPIDYTKALNYDWNDEDKYNKLYYFDKNKFLEYYVLTNYTQDKFETWIEDKIKTEEGVYAFNEKNSEGIFYKIFSIDKDWMLFMGIRDKKNNRIFFQNYTNTIIETLSKDILPNKNFKNIQLSLCLLDALFGDNYTHTIAISNINTLSSIVSCIDFDRTDFYDTKSDNYFSMCNKNGMNKIKEHVKIFFEDLFRTNSSNIPLERYCIFYEKILNNNESISSFYVTLQKNAKVQNKLFCNLRMTLYNAMLKNNIKDLSAVLSDKESKRLFFSYLDRDNMIDFIELTIHDHQFADRYVFEIINAIYRRKIPATIFRKEGTLHELELFVTRNTSREIEQLPLNEIRIKLLCYVGEVVMTPEKSAEWYNGLISKDLISGELQNYMKRRALNRYANIGERVFLQKKNEYHFFDLQIDDIQKEDYPNIENRNSHIREKTNFKRGEQLSTEEQEYLQKTEEIKIAKQYIYNDVDNDTIVKVTNLPKKVVIALKSIKEKIPLMVIRKANGFSEEFLAKLSQIR